MTKQQIKKMRELIKDGETIEAAAKKVLTPSKLSITDIYLLEKTLGNG